MRSATPHFFYISDITNSSSFNCKICRKKSRLENFRANVLKLKRKCLSACFDRLKTGKESKLMTTTSTEKLLSSLNNVSCNPLIPRVETFTPPWGTVQESVGYVKRKR